MWDGQGRSANNYNAAYGAEFERTNPLRAGFNNLCKAKFPIGDNTPLAMMQDMAAGRGRVFIACQEIKAKYQGAIAAIANNQYYTKEQRDAIIAALRAQQKAEITATRQRIQYEERQKLRAGKVQGMKPKR